MSRFKPGQQIVCIKPEGEKWTADDGSGVIGYGPKFNELVNVDYYKDNHITLIQYPQIIDGFRHAFNENEFEPLPEINELTSILESDPQTQSV